MVRSIACTFFKHCNPLDSVSAIFDALAFHAEKSAEKEEKQSECGGTTSAASLWRGTSNRCGQS